MEIAVIGGGASGILAAITAARNGAKVTIYERCDRIGRKILATGNGRCNYTNVNAGVGNYHGKNPEFINDAINNFWTIETNSFFAELGMLTKVEENGKAFPYSLQASAVLDVLRYELERLCVNIVTEFEVENIIKEKNRFSIKSYSGMKAYADKVILSTGGKASPSLGSNGSGYQIAQSFGHKLSKLYPSLVQIKTETDLIKSLKGIKLDANVLLEAKNKKSIYFGEVLFTDYGLSGPAIFNVSRLCADNIDASVTLDILPEIDNEELYEILKSRRTEYRNLETFFVGMINKKVGMVIMKYAKVLPFSRTSDTISDDEIKRLCDALKGFKLKVTGTMSWNNAQVTAGGILTDDINSLTMESRLCEGLYLTGEILDIDGDCGGYNLQWAWSSGYIAGLNASKERENA
ncbi:MAG: NAD(P)/FAD-dependent oxidoreductase [Clostridia bacterium]|nr:NAD(P)/FAD-dependent oxidoreductase [Clostridia bacterium]